MKSVSGDFTYLDIILILILKIIKKSLTNQTPPKGLHHKTHFIYSINRLRYP